MDYKIPEAGVVWPRSDADTRSDQEDVPGNGCHDSGRECEERSYTSVVVVSSTAQFIEVGSEGERSNIPQVASGEWEVSEGILGSAFVGERVFCSFNRKCYR
jgi:hypothetical protein